MTGLRILTIASELPPVHSGVARSAGRVIDGLIDRGHIVDRLSRTDAWRHDLGEFRLSALGARFVRLSRLVDGYDIIHVHGPVPFISDVFLARWRVRKPSAAPPLVYTHGFTLALDRFPRSSAIYDRATSRLLRAADVVTVTSASYADIVSALGANRVVTIPWGVDLPATEPGPTTYAGDRPLRVTFVGQQRPYKGIETLIDATAGQASLEVTIVGGGPGLDAMRERIRGHGCANVTHRGPLTDLEVSAELERTDVVVLPSTNRSEAFGLVLLEGMAHGCMVVASDLPGVCDVVGDAGLLVAPGDVSALRRTLFELAAGPDLVGELARRAWHRARRFSWDATVDGFDALFTDLVRSRA